MRLHTFHYNEAGIRKAEIFALEHYQFIFWYLLCISRGVLHIWLLLLLIPMLSIRVVNWHLHFLHLPLFFWPWLRSLGVAETSDLCRLYLERHNASWPFQLIPLTLFVSFIMFFWQRFGNNYQTRTALETQDVCNSNAFKLHLCRHSAKQQQ